MISRFIWTDLSTYQPQESCGFYSEVFGWEITDVEGYSMASLSDQVICGIYETPPFFKKIGMPHFWMNYIAVSDLEDTVTKAKDLGAIIEIENADFYKGHIALIRDPQGAGFTVYEGAGFSSFTSTHHGHIKGRELQVSDVKSIKSFYSSLFGWDVQLLGDSTYQVTSDGTYICDMQKVDNDVKGKYEYCVDPLGEAFFYISS